MCIYCSLYVCSLPCVIMQCMLYSWSLLHVSILYNSLSRRLGHEVPLKLWFIYSISYFQDERIDISLARVRCMVNKIDTCSVYGVECWSTRPRDMRQCCLTVPSSVPCIRCTDTSGNINLSTWRIIYHMVSSYIVALLYMMYMWNKR